MAPLPEASTRGHQVKQMMFRVIWNFYQVVCFTEMARSFKEGSDQLMIFCVVFIPLCSVVSSRDTVHQHTFDGAVVEGHLQAAFSCFLRIPDYSGGGDTQAPRNLKTGNLYTQTSLMYSGPLSALFWRSIMILKESLVFPGIKPLM